MHWWQVTDTNGYRHYLNLDRVADIRLKDEGDEAVLLSLDNGEHITLSDIPHRHHLVETVIADSSAVDRVEVKEARRGKRTKAPDKSIYDSIKQAAKDLDLKAQDRNRELWDAVYELQKYTGIYEPKDHRLKPIEGGEDGQ